MCHFLKPTQELNQKIQQEMSTTKIRWQIEVFGVSSGFAAVSSQFLNKHKRNCHIKLTAVTHFLAEFLRRF